MAPSFQFKVLGTRAQWTAKDPVLALGEMAIETDYGLFKIGDGVSNWSTLPYQSDAIGATGSTGAAGAGVTGSTGSAGAGVTGATAVNNTLTTQVLFNVAGGITGSSNFTYVNPTLFVASNMVVGTTVSGATGLSVGTSTFIQQVGESVALRPSIGTSNTFPWTNGAIAYVSGINANWTANITNIPTFPISRAYTYTFVIAQGGTAGYCSNLFINSVSNTIRWANNTVPTPAANKNEVQTFTIVNTSAVPGTVAFTVLGDYSTYG